MHKQARQVVADFCCMHLSLQHLQFDLFGPMYVTVVCHATHMLLSLQKHASNLIVCTIIQGAESAAWEVLPAKGRQQKPMTRQHSLSGHLSLLSTQDCLSGGRKCIHRHRNVQKFAHYLVASQGTQRQLLCHLQASPLRFCLVHMRIYSDSNLFVYPNFPDLPCIHILLLTFANNVPQSTTSASCNNHHSLVRTTSSKRPQQLTAHINEASVFSIL